MSDGFSFFKKPVIQAPKPKAKVAKTGNGCASCLHSKNLQMGKLFGNPKAKILAVVETPSQTDLAHGRPFTGKAGAVLQDILKDCDVSYDSFAIAYSSPCGKDASIACIPNLNTIIDQLDPTVIIPMGIGPVQALITSRITGRLKGQAAPSDYYGERIPDQHYRRWICPTYSPYEIARIEEAKNKTARRNPWEAIDLRNLCSTDIEYAVELVEKGKPARIDYDSMVEVITSESGAIAFLESRKSYKGGMSFDFETTGLKPQAPRHFIDCVSACFDNGDSCKSYAFPFAKNNPKFIGPWGEIMASKDIDKQAHNAAFESMWEKWRGAGEFPNNWYWDTCIAAHILHNQKPVGLKFQTYVNFGVMGYDDEMDEYLVPSKAETKKHGANAVNRIHLAPLEKKLKYCALDSLFGHLLQKKQEPLIRKPYHRKGFALFMEGMQSFVSIMDAGMGFDEDLANKQLAKLNADMAEIENRIAKMPGIYGKPGINLDSDQQMMALLYDELKFPLTRFGRKADIPALKALLNHEPAKELCSLILARNKLGTARGYLKNYIRESVDNKLRGFLGLTGVVTYRSSSDSPNMQNVSKRDKEVKAILRACFVPSPGNCIDECDLRGAEVFTSGCVHKDPNFLDYVRDWKTKDMHRDLAKQLYIRDLEYVEDPKLAKSERQQVKGPFTFACLYGMGGPDIAENMWYDFLPVTESHLQKKGLLEKVAWTSHVCSIYDDFWNRRFAVYGKWKQDHWKEFRLRGYSDTLTGFRIKAPATYNQAGNSPIQGPAFHVSLSLINYIAPRLKKMTNGRSRVINQIHDSLIFDIHPDDRPLRNKLYEEALAALRKKWPWLIVPIVVEIEGTEIDQSWDKLKELGMIISDWESK